MCPEEFGYFSHLNNHTGFTMFLRGIDKILFASVKEGLVQVAFLSFFDCLVPECIALSVRIPAYQVSLH